MAFFITSPAAAQDTRWPFRSPVSVPNDTLTDFLLDQNMPVLSVTQIMEGALSDAYIVGPGDGFLISLWGKRNEHFRTMVTPEGRLFIPQIAEIPVAGLTLAEVRKRLGAEIAKFFYDVRVEATLIQLRQFQVYVLGAVERPGPYPAHAIDRVSRLVDRAGGLLPAASARGIEIRRNGQTVETADLLRFREEGDLSLNPYVQDGDIVVVPLRTALVNIQGAVWRRGDYEFRPGDTLGRLIRLAQDFRPEAYRSEVEVARFSENGLTTTRLMVDASDTAGAGWRFPLRQDDQVFVRAIPQWHEKLGVLVTGEVRYPGIYIIDRDSTRLREVIARAGGFTEYASLRESYVVRADTSITIDPEYERLKLVPVTDMTPDEYEYFKMKARDRPGFMTIDFQRLFRDGDLSQNIVLKSADRIVVARNKETVVVTGAVASPGAVIYDPRLTVPDYIQRAGGYGWNARKNKTRVIKAKTGDWLWAGDARQLGPGDTIWVPEKPHRDWWNIFLQGLSTAGQIATIILVVNTVSR